jgi:hypothetical protein
MVIAQDKFTTYPGDLDWEDDPVRLSLVSEQAIELGWKNAWHHEARNVHGEWTHGGGGVPVSHGLPQPRGNLERFEGRDTLTPGMDPATGRKALNLPGRPDGAGTPGDPIDVQGDMPKAVQLMAAGKHVRLNGTAELPALENEVNKQADAVLKSTGAEPAWDLGFVSVRGTRLFNEQTLGIPRIDMPQLSGPAQPGSEAAILAHGANKFIELDPEFRRQLKADGVDVKNERAKTADLRATQTQLTAASVAGIARAAQQGNPKVNKMLQEPIWVSQDNYVIDGHHRWAAHALMGDAEMNIQRIGLPASVAIPYANGFSQRMGIAGVAIGNSKLVQGANLVSQQVIDMSWRDAWMHETRGPHGEWVHGGLADAVQHGTVKFSPGSLGTADHPAPAGARPKAAAEIQKALDLQDKIIPGIVDHQTVTITNHIPDAPPADAGSILGETLPSGSIYISPRVTAAFGGGVAAAKKMEKDQVDQHFWVPISSKYTAADAVTAHELGHVVGQHLEKANPHMMTSIDYWGPLAKAMGILPPRAGKTGRITPSQLGDWADRNSYAITAATSVYGSSSPWEMQGELWSEYTLSDHPRPAARAFGAYVLSHLPAQDLPAKEAAP